MSEHKHQKLADDVREALKGLGANFQNRYTGSNWAPDFIAKGDDGTIFVIEVKDREIAAPDIFAVASTTSSGSLVGKAAFGAIISNKPTYRSIAEVASENNVILLTIDTPEELSPKLKFLEQIARIETILRHLTNATPETLFPEMVRGLVKSGKLDPSLGTEIDRLWNLRNSLAHYTEHDEDFDPTLNGQAEVALTKLKKRS
jgi:hypothetical protein